MCTWAGPAVQAWRAQDARRWASAATRSRSSSGRSITNGQSSAASSGGNQSSRSTRKWDRMPPLVRRVLLQPSRHRREGGRGSARPSRGSARSPRAGMVSRREPRQHPLRRVGIPQGLERTGQGPCVRDAIQPEGPVLADLGVRARDVPPARMAATIPCGCSVRSPLPPVAVGVPDRDQVGGGVPRRRR